MVAHIETNRALAVAITATLSLIACVLLGALIIWLLVKYRRMDTWSTPTTSGIRFLRTQAGIIYTQLLLADAIQALGFGLTWKWWQRAQIDDFSGACLLQSLCIEAGDVASAFFSMLIAMHTFTMLVLEWRPTTRLLVIICAATWAIVLFLTGIGPAAIATREKGSFYGPAGSWCWIQTAYESSRLWLHYLFVFLSAGVQVVCYGTVFYVLRFRVPLRTFAAKEAGSGPLTRTSTWPLSSWKKAKNLAHRFRFTGNSAKASRSELSRTSMLVLLYPAFYLPIVMPLSIYRLMAMSGRPGSPAALAVCGAIFASGGLANVLLYSFSRHLLRLPFSNSGVVRLPASNSGVVQVEAPFTIDAFDGDVFEISTKDLGKSGLDEESLKEGKPFYHCKPMELERWSERSRSESNVSLKAAEVPCSQPTPLQPPPPAARKPFSTGAEAWPSQADLLTIVVKQEVITQVDGRADRS